MKTKIYPLYFVLGTFVLLLMSSCEPKALAPEDVLEMDEEQMKQDLQKENPEGYTIYNINDFLDAFMTEDGNFKSDSSRYRTRSPYNGLELFSLDTLPTNGSGIYIRGRVSTDDYGGNFYKAVVIQQVVDWNTGEGIDQQNLRISLDLGSAGGMFQQGQELLIRCNGLAVGRYANQPQLCVPTYNNNIHADKEIEKVGWAPGRIPSAKFRKAARLVGLPDKSKLVYDEMNMATLHSNFLGKYQDIVGARKVDGRLVRITNVHYTGTCANEKNEEINCNRYANPVGDPTKGNPEKDKYAYTFGPTTQNVGHPQSRYVQNNVSKRSKKTYKVFVSTSEYARYAHYYLPAEKYSGSITGILGYYMDNGAYDPDGGEWAITPCNLEDILPEAQNAEDPAARWTPTEWKLGVPQPE